MAFVFLRLHRNIAMAVEEVLRTKVRSRNPRRVPGALPYCIQYPVPRVYVYGSPRTVPLSPI